LRLLWLALGMTIPAVAVVLLGVPRSRYERRTNRTAHAEKPARPPGPPRGARPPEGRRAGAASLVLLHGRGAKPGAFLTQGLGPALKALGRLWRSGGETPADAFDDAQDFARHDVVNSRFPFRGAVWLDLGAADPFLVADTAFARRHGLRLRVWPGGHSNGHWGEAMRAYVRVYAQALRSCR
jgi:hypothetical protein